MKAGNLVDKFIYEIIDEMNSIDQNWNDLEYILIASSANGPGYSVKQFAYNIEGKRLELGSIAWLHSLLEEKIELFKSLNLNEKINKLTFIFKDKKFVELVKSWDQSIQDEFELYLPKSKKGKIRAWYLPPLDTASESTSQSIPQEIILPKLEVSFDTSAGKTVDEYIREMNKAVYYPNDPLWDGAFYWIKKQDGSYTSNCQIYLFPSIEDKNEGVEAEEVNVKLEVTEDLKSLYNNIKDIYHKENPQVPFDSIFVTVQKDGRYIVNYEMEDEEVQPNLPPVPDVITA